MGPVPDSCDKSEGRADGKGIMKYVNGDVYEGIWMNGERFYQGTCKYANGDVYEGRWEANLRARRGRCSYRNGDMYDGEWKSDMKVGVGTMQYGNRNKYVGQWLVDKRNGTGKCVFFRGTGPAVDGKPGDPDVDLWDEYDGAWHSGDRHGAGRQKYVVSLSSSLFALKLTLSI